MAGQRSHVVTVSTAGGYHSPPTQNVGGRVRIHNLDGTNSIWLGIGLDASTSAAEGDDTIRVGPGEQYISERQTRFHMTAVGGDVKALLETV